MGLPDLWETGWSDISLKRSKRIKRLYGKYRCKVCVILRSFAGYENGLDPVEGKALQAIVDREDKGFLQRMKNSIFECPWWKRQSGSS